MEGTMHELQRLGRITIISMLPFLVLNTIVSQQLQPMLDWLRPTGHTSGIELFALGTSILWCGIGALSLIWPFRQPASWARVRIPRARARIMGEVALCSLVVLLAITLGDEIYRCDILKQPNCD
jgi:hypothetical protein